MGFAGHSELPDVSGTALSNDIDIAIQYLTERRDGLISDLTDELKNNAYYGHLVDSIKEELNDIIKLNDQIRVLQDCILFVAQIKNGNLKI